MRNLELGEVLLSAGAVDQEQLEEVYARLTKEPEATIGAVLDAMGLVDEVTVVKLFCSHFNLPYVDLGELEVPCSVTQTLDRHAAQVHQVVPFRIDGERLFLATSSPWRDEHTLVHAEYQTVFALTESRSLREALFRQYG